MTITEWHVMLEVNCRLAYMNKSYLYTHVSIKYLWPVIAARIEIVLTSITAYIITGVKVHLSVWKCPGIMNRENFPPLDRSYLMTLTFTFTCNIELFYIVYLQCHALGWHDPEETVLNKYHLQWPTKQFIGINKNTSAHHAFHACT